MTQERITTREACEILNLPNLAACVAFLQAARCERTRCGAAYLWDAERVRELASLIGKGVNK